MFYTLKPHKLLHFFIFELYTERDLTVSLRASGSFSSNWMFRSGHRWSVSVFKNNIKKNSQKVRIVILSSFLPLSWNFWNAAGLLCGCVSVWLAREGSVCKGCVRFGLNGFMVWNDFVSLNIPLLFFYKKKKNRCVTVTENVPSQPKHKSQNKSKLLTISRKVID